MCLASLYLQSTVDAKLHARLQLQILKHQCQCLALAGIKPSALHDNLVRNTAQSLWHLSL